MDEVLLKRYSCSDFSESEYLEFLAQRVPKDLGVQLTHDANPDLMLSKYVDLADLMRPLYAHSFLKDWDSHLPSLSYLTGILEHLLIGYVLKIEENTSSLDPYMQIYIASYYLYCWLHGRTSAPGYTCTLLVLVNSAGQITLEGQFQVSRFLGSLIPMISTETVADPAPLSSALIALCAILTSAARRLGPLIERAMHEEGFERAWKEEESEFADGNPAIKAMATLRRLVSSVIPLKDSIREGGTELR